MLTIMIIIMIMIMVLIKLPRHVELLITCFGPDFPVTCQTLIRFNHVESCSQKQNRIGSNIWIHCIKQFEIISLIVPVRFKANLDISSPGFPDQCLWLIAARFPALATSWTAQFPWLFASD